MERRHVSSRSNKAIRRLAAAIAATSITANQVSAFSVVASLLVPFGLLVLGGWAGTLLAMAGIQLRLLANVIDGLVAVEGGKQSAVGALYNEFPDRIADCTILIALGYACAVPSLGWLAALLAALTAYVRVFGGALGQPQTFQGPMAKQHRMAVATAVLLAAPVLDFAVTPSLVLQAGLVVIAIGSALTCVTRTRTIVKLLNKAPQP